MAGRILTALLTYIGVALYHLGAAPLVRWLGRKNPKVLLYHDCADAETSYVADLDCTTRPQTFDRHLDYVQRHHTVVPLETLVTGDAPEGAVAITFDDGYRSVYENAYPVLKRRQLPATLYLIANVVGNEDLVWVNELNHALRADPEGTRTIVGKYFDISEAGSAQDVISICRLTYDPRKMERVLDEVRAHSGRSVADHAREASLYVDWDQVAEMEENAITFGNHTMTHPNMERLDEDEQRLEIVGAHEILLPRLKRVHSFAHPFGHRGSKAAEIAAEAGSLCSVEVGGGNRTIRPLRIGRVHLSDQSVAEMFARMEIVEPVKEWLRTLGSRSGKATSAGY